MNWKGLVTTFRQLAPASGPSGSGVAAIARAARRSENDDAEKSKSNTDTQRASISFRNFFILWAELGLILTAAYVLKIEEAHGLPQVLPIIFIGFAVNAWAPLQYRPAVFLALGIASIMAVLGPWDSLWLLGLGTSLFAICQLPSPLKVRVALLLAAGGLLAALRVQWISLPGSDRLALVVLPMLAAMFMFRLAVYLHDKQYERQPGTLSQRLSYFFLLPNSCFPLFPVIDYRSFRRNYYNAQAVTIYQKGARWIMRGIVHLTIYRLVYYHFTPTFDDINDLAGVGQYVISSYLMYLRVSGMFHVIVGTLCLFGFNLPETHRLYFLSSSFTDFWRRINIYWKDFMMKFFYYPLFVRLKGAGVPIAMAAATFVTLVVSWLLHSYQIFWLRGSFPLLIQDAVFWSFLGIAVAINSLIEYRSGRLRSGDKQVWAPKAAFILSLKTVAMFCAMSLLWSFWTSSSVAEWVSVMRIGLESSSGEKFVLLGILAVAVLLGTAWQILMSRSWVLSTEREPPFIRAAATTSALALLAMLVVVPGMDGHFGPSVQNVVASVRAQRPNLRDQELEMRGYYEELLGAEQTSQAVWRSAGEPPKDWLQIHESAAVRETNDARRYELLPNVEIVFKGAPFRTNSFGMRDREYSLVKPPGTCRIALFGDSYSMGAGVTDEQSYATILENRLNQARPVAGCDNYEILNFAIGGYSAVQTALAAKVQIPKFDPDIVIYATAHNDSSWAMQRLAYAIEEGARLDEPFLAGLRERAGLSADLNHYELRRRLKPVASELVEWAYADIAEAASSAEASSLWICLPRLGHDPEDERDRCEETSKLARAANFATLSIDDIWKGRDNEELYIAAWDKHPNSMGHELIAERLYTELAPNWTSLLPGK